MSRVAAVLVMYLLGQVSGVDTRRFGWLGERLSPSEMDEIAGLAATVRGQPWLVLGHRSMALGVASVDVFLQPDTKGSQVSRGRLLRLIADDPPEVSQRSAWRVHETKSFVYIAAYGRPPFEIVSEQDVSWPFIIQGDFDDATLVSLVAFIRSSPRMPGREEQIPNQVAVAPISAVWRQHDTIFVGLRTGANTGQTVTIVAAKGAWRITNISQWIA